MGSRVTLLFVIAAVWVLAFSVQAGSSAGMWLSRTTCSANEPAKLELRCGQKHLWHEASVLRWIKHHPTLTLSAEDPQVIAYYTQMRRNHLWLRTRARRWVREARGRLSPVRSPSVSHGGIAHEALWLCIHTGYLNGRRVSSGEGAWNSNTGNGFYGGLQMTSPWGKGAYYVSRADLLTPYEQMRKAELGYIASGHSTGWLKGQWPNTSPPCLRLAG